MNKVIGTAVQGRIQKFFYEDDNSLISFRVYKNKQQFFLNLMNKDNTFFYLTRKKEFQSKENSFVMFLRKQLTNQTLSCAYESTKFYKLVFFPSETYLLISKTENYIGYFKNDKQVIKVGKTAFLKELPTQEFLQIEENLDLEVQLNKSNEIKTKIQDQATSAQMRKIQIALKKLNKKVNIQRKELEDLESDNSTHLGQLILANMYSYSGRVPEIIDVTDYMTNEEISIKLDPSISMQNNANNYFKKGKKVRAIQIKKDIIAKTEKQISLLSNDLLTQGDKAEFVLSNKLLPVQRKSSRLNEVKIISRNYEYTRNQKIEFMVGVNSKSNDIVSFKYGQDKDYWFHIANMPGSHVIVKLNGEQITPELIQIGAVLAGINSSVKQKGKLAINYCPRKNVHKFNGAKPGQVRLDKYQTIFIQNEIDLIKNKIKEKNK
jgi:predicted ribosome quality control (RQC) complex YloA/Tae2 family protein